MTTDTTNVDIAGMLAACMHCLNVVVSYMKNENLPDLLKISLLRLRMSRIGEASIYPSLASPFRSGNMGYKASAEFSKFLELLQPGTEGVQDSHDSPEPAERLSANTRNELVNKIVERMSQIVTARLLINENIDIPSEVENYQGHINWSKQQYAEAAGILTSLEKAFGVRKLRGLSDEERERILSGDYVRDSDLSDLLSTLDAAANQLDPWTESWVSEISTQMSSIAYSHAGMANITSNVANDVSVMVHRSVVSSQTTDIEPPSQHTSLAWLRKLRGRR